MVVSHDRLQIANILTRRFGRSAALEIVDLPEQPLAVIAKVGSPPGLMKGSSRFASAVVLEKILAGQEVPLDFLTHCKLVGLDPRSGVRQQLERKLAGHERALQFGPQAAGWAAVKAYVRQGLGVGVVPSALANAPSQSCLL